MKAKKTLLIAVAMLLVAAISVGGTLAYLKATSASVTNTFVAKELGSVTVNETTGDVYYVVPGVDITKDPKLSFTRTTADPKDDVDAYVFVEVTATGWTLQDDNKTFKNGTGMTFEIASGWAHLSGNVFYTEISAGNGISGAAIIKEDKITVPATITEETIVNAASTVTFQGYAIQKPGFNSASAAWAEIKAPTDRQ